MSLDDMLLGDLSEQQRRALFELKVAIAGNVKTNASRFWMVSDQEMLRIANETLRTVHTTRTISWGVKDVIRGFKAMCQYIAEEEAPQKLAEFMSLRSALDNSYRYVAKCDDEGRRTPEMAQHVHWFEEGRRVYNRYEEMLYSFKFRTRLVATFYTHLEKVVCDNYEPITMQQIYGGIKQITDRDWPIGPHRRRRIVVDKQPVGLPLPDKKEGYFSRLARLVYRR
ncbi:hypothetical protein HYX12_01965 [Candidatus Woesearchaeota archaeon]|nr:hypothetical protein [Candidatus Woesearchaeota archaeon]